MKIYKFIIAVAVVAVSATLFISRSSSDTIITNDGKEIKGIVIEDYKDRVLFSTVDGEITVMKSDIRELYFDSEEDNLVKLAEQAAEHREYARAMNYYEKALKVNPKSAAAKQGIVYLRGNIFRSEEEAKADAIKRQQDIELYGSNAAIVSEQDDINNKTEKLEKTTGLKLDIQDGAPIIEYVKPGSPASEAGLKKGDKLVSVWDKLTGYMSLKEMLDLIITKSAIEIRCTIDRSVDVRVNPGRTPISRAQDLIGADLVMETDGLTVSSVRDGTPAMESGIQQGDLITSINGSKTRYMPLNKAVDLIRSCKDDMIGLVLRRKATIWRNSNT